MIAWQLLYRIRCIFYLLCWWWLRWDPAFPYPEPSSGSRRRSPDSRWSTRRWWNNAIWIPQGPLPAGCRQVHRAACLPTRLTWPCPHPERNVALCLSPGPMTARRPVIVKSSTSSPATDSRFIEQSRNHNERIVTVIDWNQSTNIVIEKIIILSRYLYSSINQACQKIHDLSLSERQLREDRAIVARAAAKHENVITKARKEKKNTPAIEQECYHRVWNRWRTWQQRFVELLRERPRMQMGASVDVGNGNRTNGIQRDPKARPSPPRSFCPPCNRSAQAKRDRYTSQPPRSVGLPTLRQNAFPIRGWNAVRNQIPFQAYVRIQKPRWSRRSIHRRGRAETERKKLSGSLSTAYTYIRDLRAAEKQQVEIPPGQTRVARNEFAEGDYFCFTWKNGLRRNSLSARENLCHGRNYVFIRGTSPRERDKGEAPVWKKGCVIINNTFELK